MGSIKVLSQNIRSISKNFCKLKDFLEDSEETFHIIALQEVWQIMGKFILKDYGELIYKERKNSRGGGVGVFVKRGFEHTLIKDRDIFDEHNYESLCIAFNKLNLVIINVYRPPNGNVKLFYNYLKTQIEAVNQKNMRPVIVGDMNINALNGNPSWNEVSTLLAEFGLCNTVKQFTRYQGLHGTIIDHCYADPTQAKCKVIGTEITDHEGISIQLRYKVPIIRKKNKNKIDIFTYKQDDISAIRHELNQIDWNNTFHDKTCDDCASFLESKLSDLAAKHCKKTVTIKPDKSWHSNNLKKLKLKLLKAKETYKNNCNVHTEQAYKMLKQKYNRQYIREQNTFNNGRLREKDPKKLWSNINDITLRKPRTEREKPPISSEAFCKHFNTIASTIENNLPHVADDPLHYVEDSDKFPFSFKRLTATEVLKLMKQIKPKRSHGKDNISNKLISLLKTSLLEPLTLIINKIFVTSTFPKNWKTARVIPLHKGGDHKDTNNYRPISLLPALSKIAEKAIATQIYSHFENNNIFPQDQFGFRKNRGTGQALVKLVYEVEKLKTLKMNYAIILIDFSKAFDIINHDILFRKLQAYGFNTNARNLIKSYLTNRIMYMDVMGDTSNEAKCHNVGCPQGSILGPLIYLIYTTDIKKLLENEVKLMFADDTAIICQLDDNNETALRKLKGLLTRLYNHFTANRLKMNVTKTVILSPKTRGKVDLQAGNINIERVNASSKYLGVHITANLNWDNHIMSLESKVKKGIFALSKISKIANTQTKNMVYNALVKSHLTYGIAAWGFSMNGGQRDKLFKLQKIAIRKVTGTHRVAHTSPIFHKLNEMKLIDLIDMAVFTECLKINSPLRQYYKIEPTNTRAALRITPKLISSTLNKHIKTITNNLDLVTTELSRKTKLKHFIKRCLDRYDVVCDIPNCYSCI